jgi:hypothetical protein
MKPPFMGYACFQSAVIAINQLRVSQDDDFHENLETLKTLLTMIRIMKNMHAPAENWVSQVVTVHNRWQMLNLCRPKRYFRFLGQPAQSP